MCLVAQSCLALCDPIDCSPSGFSVHGDSSGKNTGVGCHAFLQGIFPTQELNWGLLYCRQILYQLSYWGSPPNKLHTLKSLSQDLIPGEPKSRQKNSQGLSRFKGKHFAQVQWGGNFHWHSPFQKEPRVWMRNMNPLPTLPKNLIQLVYPGGVSLFLSRFGVYLVTFSTHKKNLSEVDRRKDFCPNCGTGYGYYLKFWIKIGHIAVYVP